MTAARAQWWRRGHALLPVARARELWHQNGPPPQLPRFPAAAVPTGGIAVFLRVGVGLGARIRASARQALPQGVRPLVAIIAGVATALVSKLEIEQLPGVPNYRNGISYWDVKWPAPAAIGSDNDSSRYRFLF